MNIKRYGGCGFEQFLKTLTELKLIINNENYFNNIVKLNMLKLLTWPVAEKPKIISIKMWTCPEFFFLIL